jgi:single-stranded DNA-binding protein
MMLPMRRIWTDGREGRRRRGSAATFSPSSTVSSSAMFSAVRAARTSAVHRVRERIRHWRDVALTTRRLQAFSTSAARAHDVSKLTLIGRLGGEPQVKTTKNGKEYITYGSCPLLLRHNALTRRDRYTVATTNYPPPPPNPDGTRAAAGTSWHHVYSFHPSANNYLRTLGKGARVFVEANFEMREGAADADGGAAQAQRQIFLRHGAYSEACVGAERGLTARCRVDPRAAEPATPGQRGERGAVRVRSYSAWMCWFYCMLYPPCLILFAPSLSAVARHHWTILRHDRQNRSTRM